MIIYVKNSAFPRKRSFFACLYELQNVHKDGEAQKEQKSDGVDDRLHLAADGLFAHPLDGGEHHLAAVDRGDGEQVEYGEVDAQKARDLQKSAQDPAGELRRQRDGGDGSPQRGQPELPREELAEHLEDGARDLEGIGEGAAERLPKPEAVGGVGEHPRSALPLRLIRDAQRPPHVV